MIINIEKEAIIERTPRVEMLETMFEVPASTKLSVSLKGSLDLNERPWNIGLIVGPSGSGKTLLLNSLFGEPPKLEWSHSSIIDDFDPSLSMEDITRVCQCVGFNTIPSWMRPFSVLSNGERFRADVARRLVTQPPCNQTDNSDNSIITIDEFTSVVDRQVAQIASHSIQKYIRATNKRMVAASCHYDIIDWLQPDWILEPGRECKLTWRCLQRRPPLTVSVSRVKYETWNLFKDFHYMSQDLNKAARCYGLFVQSTASSGVGTRFHESILSSQTERYASDDGDDIQSRFPSAGMRHQRYDPAMVRLEGSRDENAQFGPSETTSSKDSTNDECGGQSGSAEGGSEHPQSRIENSHGHDGSTTADDVQQYAQGIRLADSQLSMVRSDIRHTNRIASMCGVLYRPHPKVSDIVGFTRMVTLPDWQGIGLAFVLATTVASAYRAVGKRLHSYPNHPAWIRSYQRSKDWLCVKKPGDYSPKRGATSTVGGFGDKRCAVYLYTGPPMTSREEAERLIYADKDAP